MVSGLIHNCWGSKLNCLDFMHNDEGMKSCANANKSDTNGDSTQRRSTTQLAHKQVLQKYIQTDLHEFTGLDCNNGNVLLTIPDTISTLRHLKHS